MRTLAIGDLVTTPNGQAGVLRWTGRVSGKPIEYAGVELTSGQGLHSGEYEGHKYFEVSQPGSGIFVSYSKLVSANTSVRTPVQLPHAVHTAHVTRATSVHARNASSSSSSGSKPWLAPASDRDSKMGFHFGPPANLGSPMSPRRPEPEHTSNEAEIKHLRTLLEEKEARIKDLKASRELQRSEFRLHIQSIEADRNQIAEHYEAALRDASGPNAHEAAEIEVQRTALAAMQNKLMEENEQMRQSLEQAQREAREAKAGSSGTGSDTNLDDLLQELTQQEARLAELQESVQELDALRTENAALRDRAAEMEAQLDEVVALKDSLKELELAPSSDELEQLKEKLAVQEKKAKKYAQEAEEARKESQTYFKMSMEADDAKETAAKLQAELDEYKQKVHELEREIELLKSAPPASAPAPIPTTPMRAKENPNGDDFVFTPSPSTRKQPHRTPVRTPVHAAVQATSRAISDRELEDQILREAGLLDPPPSVPPPKIDPAAGRDMWCGLCEKSGHTTVDCPYD